MEIGDAFPSFVLPDEDGIPFDGSRLAGHRYVMFFYPKDGSQGCTREASEFSARIGEFFEAGVSVIGVSKDSSSSHRRFIDRNDLKIKLLSDRDHSLMDATGVWGPKISYGKETLGTRRTTFVVGPDGKVEASWRVAKVAGHVDEVLSFVLSNPRSRQFPIHRPQDISRIGDEADVGIAVDGGMGVLVDRYDPGGSRSPCHMLGGSGYTEGDIEVWGDGAAGQPHLTRPRHPSLLDQCSGAYDSRIHSGRDRFRDLYERSVAYAVAESYQDATPFDIRD